MLEKVINSVYQKIVEYNSKDNLKAIPHSDAFEKDIVALYGLKEHELKRILTILKESHMIFTFEITQEDKDRDIKRINGYVEADLVTVRRLKSYFQRLLMDEYEQQFNTQLLFHRIAREVYTNPTAFKNTPLGQLANKAIMLDEYEHLLEKEYGEYTESWKKEKLNEIIQNTDNLLTEQKVPLKKKDTDDEQKSLPSQRAVDSREYQEFSSTSSGQSLNKILKIYGVEFFFRVSLRKYQFDQLTDIIEKKVIYRRQDLKQLKSMLQKVKKNTAFDPNLKKHSDAISRLDRTVSKNILIN